MTKSNAPLNYVFLSGRSSVVEHNLAKVGVVGSNLIARSILSNKINNLSHFQYSIDLISENLEAIWKQIVFKK